MALITITLSVIEGETIKIIVVPKRLVNIRLMRLEVK